MAIRAERFVVSEGEVRGVVRTDSRYNKHVKTKDGGYEEGEEVYEYTLEIYLFDRGSIYVAYDQDEAGRDADYELVAAVVR